MKHFSKTEDGRHHLCSLPCSRLPVSLGKELIYSLYEVLIFAAAAPEIPLDCSTVVASGAQAYWSHRTVTNSKRVLNQLPFPGYSRKGID